MISELSFSRKFTSFWNELIPGCDAYVRLINQGLMKRHSEPIDYEEEPSNRALINGVGFLLFKKVVNKELKLDSLGTIEREDVFEEIVNTEQRFLSRFSRHSEPKLPFRATEIKSIRVIATRLCERFKKSKLIVTAPLFLGCGILNAAEGDVWADNMLVEVKAGERSFSVYDIRQLLTYCALNYQGGNKYVIENIELFNPRVGVSFSESLDEVSRNVGSMSSAELLSEIISFVSETNFIEPPFLQ